MVSLRETRIGVVGMGYVGLPLAVGFGRRFPTTGFDVKPARIAELRRGRDSTREVAPAELRAARKLAFTADPGDLSGCTTFLVAVPTPIDASKRPDLAALDSACATVAGALRPGNVVVFESTVYPGCTEERCVPILEQLSGLRLNRDFHVGYSPERINPGDREHRLETVRKVTSGSTPAAARYVAALYGCVVKAGTHPASSIRVAEAAKVIENTQRDVNIALVNELAMLFERMGLDTREVLDAAGTKWNFLPFRPGLVGGHCIGVDPYYLTYKAESIGFHPEMILAGRRVNDHMGAHVALRVIQLMLRRKIHVARSRVLVLGMTFKENCADIRNSRSIDIVREFLSIGARVDVADPCARPEDVAAEYGVAPLEDPPRGAYDALILAVGHRQYRRMGAARIRRWGKPRSVFFDVKSLFAVSESDGRL